MALTPTEADTISAAIESALIDVHVALPGQVQSYDAATQTATIELQVQRVLPQGINFVTESLPVLENVPVQFQRTNTHIMTLPLAAGDYGLVIFSEMSIDQWRSKGDNTSPGDIGRHTLTGGVFQPGLMPLAETVLPTSDVLSADIVIGKIGGGQLRVKPGNTIEAVAGGASGQSADDFVAMAGQVLARLEALETAHNTHIHITTATIGAGATPGVLSPPAIIVSPAITAVASSNLKAND